MKALQGLISSFIVSLYSNISKWRISAIIFQQSVGSLSYIESEFESEGLGIALISTGNIETTDRSRIVSTGYIKLVGYYMSQLVYYGSRSGVPDPYRPIWVWYSTARRSRVAL